MRILMVTGEYPPRRGGVGDYTARLTEALRAAGHAVTVLTGAAPAPPQPGLERAIANWGLGCWRPIVAALDRTAAEVVHLQYQPGAFELNGAINLLPAWLRRRRPAARVVTTFHDLRVPYLFPKAGPLRALAVRALLRGSHGAIFVDPLDLATAGPGPNRRWVPIGSNVPCRPPADFDPQRVRTALGVHTGHPLIGFFGFLTASKGAPTLLHALRLLRDAGRPAELALLGAAAGSSNPTDQADRTAAEALVDRLGLATAVHATGYLEPAALSAHLLACDALALPYLDGASFRRGSLLAAFEHRRAVVSTPPAAGAAGRAPRLLKPERQFLAVPPDDPPALAAALGRLLDDPALAGRLGRAAGELAARCGWDAIAAETAEVYARAHGRAPARTADPTPA